MQHEKGIIHWDDLHFETDPEKYKGFTAYNQSKLANVMHAMALSRKYKQNNIKTYSLHPGKYIKSNSIIKKQIPVRY